MSFQWYHSSREVVTNMNLGAVFFSLVVFINIMEPVTARKIKTFYLNKKFDIRNPICDDCPDPQCVYTMNDSIPFPRTMTLCFRIQPMNYISPKWRYSTAMSFGSLQPDWTDMDEGFFFGIWDTGPWLALKERWFSIEVIKAF